MRHLYPIPSATVGTVTDCRQQLADMVTRAQREEALDLATRLMCIARHPGTPPALFIELGRNMEDGLRAGGAA
jgi:hypothetical protein